MTKVRIVLNKRGVQELLKSDDLRQTCASHAGKALAKLGTGYETDTHTGKTRSNATIWASSAQARRDARQNNTIWKAVKGH